MQHRRSRLERLARLILPIMALVLLALLAFHAGYFRGPMPHPSRAETAKPAGLSPSSEDGLPAQDPAAAAAIEHWDYRKTSDFDPGTIRVFIRNVGKAPLRIREVILDELPVPVWGVDLNILTVKPEGELTKGETAHAEVPRSAALRFSGKRVVWAKLAPEAIPPGHVAEFAAKLSNPMTRPMKVEFFLVSSDVALGMGATEAPVSLVVRPLKPALAITAVTFSPGYDRLYTYVKNDGDAPQEIAGVCLNGESVAPLSWWGRGPFSLGEKQLIVTDMKKPLEQGAFIVVEVTTVGGAKTMERVRVFGGFPINSEGSADIAAFGGDAPGYAKRPDFLTIDDPSRYAPDQDSSPNYAANYILSCPMHEYGGDLERCAREILRRYDLCRRFAPAHPCFVHCCRARAETGYALFGETTDILRINSNIVGGLSPRRAGEPSEQNVEQLTRYAVNAARPRPVHAVADTSTIEGGNGLLATCSDFRRRTWTLLGCGVKGIFYRHRGWTTLEGTRLSREVKQTNEVLNQARPYLGIADTVDWATAPKSFSAHALLAGDQALLVLLVRHDHPAENATERPIQVSLYVPAWLRVLSASETQPLKAVPAPIQKTDAGIDLTVVPPADAAIFILPLERGQP